MQLVNIFRTEAAKLNCLWPRLELCFWSEKGARSAWMRVSRLLEIERS